MRLLILSDLHLELWREHAPKIDPSVSRPDAVVLAGDIHTGGKAVDWAAGKFPGLPVLYVHGNHEAYGRTLNEAKAETREACERNPDVHFLDCGEIVLGGVRFLGCTLWTDFQLFSPDRRYGAMLEARAAMNDYQRIRVAEEGFRKLHPADTARIHAKHRSWLKRKLDESFDGKTVVITHMGPSMRSVADQYAHDITSAAFSSNLDHLVDQADLWVHGHTHTGFDYQIGMGRVVCNPCGYMNRAGGTENEHFDPNFIVEV